jgi:hypothetical protein
LAVLLHIVVCLLIAAGFGCGLFAFVAKFKAVANRQSDIGR